MQHSLDFALEKRIKFPHKKHHTLPNKAKEVNTIRLIKTIRILVLIRNIAFPPKANETYEMRQVS
jgi:hypothetical protein